MSNTNDAEKRRIIEAMNERLGTKHRSEPYDKSKPDDLKHALLMAVAAYRDYRHYACTLDGMMENYDESLEVFNPASWFNMGINPDGVDGLELECASSLRESGDMFDRLEARARGRLIKTLLTVLSAPIESQIAVLGRAYVFSVEEIEERIECLLEMLDETDYCYPIDDNFDALLKVMEEQWGAP